MSDEPPAGGHILVVDDDPSLLRVVEMALQARGHRVTTTSTGRDALDLAATEDPDVVILDLGLPDMDGIDVGRHLRRLCRAMIVVLSADGAEDRKVTALDGTADDYLTKPFSMRELVARVGVALRHRREVARRTGDEVLAVGTLRIDLAGHHAELAGAPVELTPKEFRLLTLLAQNEGRLLTHRLILDSVWGPGQAMDTLRTHVSQLRRKLGDAPGAPRLLTEAGVGYRLVAD